MSSEEFFQRKPLESMIKIGEFNYIDLGNTTFNQLIRSNTISNNVDDSFLQNKPDALILKGKETPYEIVAIVEYKKPEVFKKNDDYQKGVQQMSEYCWATSVNIGCITDGTNYDWYNVNSSESNFKFEFTNQDKNYEVIYTNPITYESNKNLVKTPDLKNKKESQLIASEIIKSIDKTSSVLISGKVITDPTDLANKVWQSIYLATGEDPKMCLMTFTEIFMYKYLSDINIINIDDSGIDISFEATFKKGQNHCLKFYQNTVRPFIKEIFTDGEDGTTIINGLSLKADRNQDQLFHQILSEFNYFGSLAGVSIEFKSNLFEEFLKGSNGTKLMAQFFTPRNIVRTIVEMSQVSQLSDDSTICDPASGVGGFILESIIDRGANNEFYFDSKNNTFASHLTYSGYDFDKHTIVLAKASLAILLADYIQDYTTDFTEIAKYINDVFHSMHKSSIGSLSVIDEKYDLILSNPPYVRKGFANYRQYIEDSQELNSHYDVNVNSKEGLFVINIVKSLKPNGKAFIILPDGFFHTKSDQYLRDFVLDNCILDGIISLPAKTFYTTAKKTYILCITKKRNTNEVQETPVFNYIVTDVGESLDAVRVDTSLDDLHRLEIEFKRFTVGKMDYVIPEDSPQIFLKDIDHYKNDNMWMSDRLLGKKEMKKIGILEDAVYNNFEDVLFELSEITAELQDLITQAKSFGNLSEYLETIQTKDLNLGNEHLFNFRGSGLGYKQREYREIAVNEGVPLYTAAKKVVAYLDIEINDRHKRSLIKASKDKPSISIATDGDGTAGTNIILHTSPYLLNTSRIAIEILNEEIIPEYIYYSIKDIKPRTGLGYSVKANKDNIIKHADIRIPINTDGTISVEKQRSIVEDLKQKENLLLQIEDLESRFREINQFNKFSAMSNM